MARGRRKAARTKKRVKVEYGVDDLESKGFTEDISVGGLLLRCRKLLPINSQIHMKISWPEGSFYVEGVVVRQKQVVPQLRRVEMPAMGIRFLSPAEVVDRVLPSKLQSDTRLAVDCASAEGALKLLSEQLDRGVLFVPVGDPPPVPAQVVDFALVLSWRGDATSLKGRGRVVQMLETGPGGKPGAVLEVEGAQALAHEMRGLLDG